MFSKKIFLIYTLSIFCYINFMHYCLPVYASSEIRIVDSESDVSEFISETLLPAGDDNTSETLPPAGDDNTSETLPPAGDDNTSYPLPEDLLTVCNSIYELLLELVEYVQYIAGFGLFAVIITLCAFAYKFFNMFF